VEAYRFDDRLVGHHAETFRSIYRYFETVAGRRLAIIDI
jgi:hypothetical protein